MRCEYGAGVGLVLAKQRQVGDGVNGKEHDGHRPIVTIYEVGTDRATLLYFSAATFTLTEDDGLEISPAGRQRVLTAYRMIDVITIESRPLKADLQRFGRRQPGCRALVDSQYGIGGLLAVVCGPSSATANASPVPNKSCVTAAWT